MAEYLFSYGTLRDRRVQNRIFGRQFNGTADILKGYRLEVFNVADTDFLANGGNARQQTVVKTNDPTESIEGMVFQITKDELILADKYEPAEYRRVEVTLMSGKVAWTYMAV